MLYKSRFIFETGFFVYEKIVLFHEFLKFQSHNDYTLAA